MRQLEISKQLILDLVNAKREENPDMNLKRLSRLLGRNDAYLQQYIHRDSPKLLPERLRHDLANLLGTNERLLREDRWSEGSEIPKGLSHIQAIPFVDACDKHPFSAHYFCTYQLLKLVPSEVIPDLRMARLLDDSMAPDLPKDAIIMLNMADNDLRKVGLYLLGVKDDYMVRHVSSIFHQDNNQTPKTVRITTNNPAFAAIRAYSDKVPVLGKVIWYARSLNEG